MNYIVTPSGRAIDPANPRVENITLEDVAYGLAKEERFSGNTFVPYSVAQHSVHVCELLASGFYGHSTESEVRSGLLHDAAEAYLGDIVTPLKKLLPDFQALEDKWQHIIAERFDLIASDFHSPFIKSADSALFQCEALTLTKKPEQYGVDRRTSGELLDKIHTQYEDIGCILVPYVWPRLQAAQRFLEVASMLSIS